MNEPKIRFKGFDEEWEEESLSELFVERHEISTITESLPQLSFTISEGVIYPNDRKSNKRDFLIKDITNKKYLVTFVGDIIYNPANVIYGAIHRNSLCDGVVSPIYKIFNTEQDSNFMECVVRNPLFISQLSMKTEGTVTKLKTLKPESFLEMIVKIAPSIYEQQKIASYFQALDTLIQTASKKLASLRQIKEASLQTMFPQEGETTPKVRFKGFNKDWNTYKIDDIANRFDNLRIPIKESNREKGETPYYGANGIQDYVKGFTHEGEYILVAEDGANDLVHYPVQYVKGKIWVNNHVHVLQSKENRSNNLFLKYAISGANIKLLLVGGSRSKLNADTLMNLKLNIPILPEQQKIASFFHNLDTQISLQTQRLEKLKQIKAACLDKMFV